MKKIPFRTILGVLFLVMMGAFIAKSVAAGPANMPRDRDEKKAARVVTPKVGADERAPGVPPGMVGGAGIVEPRDRETKVAVAVPGRLAKLLVQEGAAVDAGAPLAELDNAPEKASLDAAEAEVVTARAELSRTSHGLRREDVDAAIAEADAAKARAESSKKTWERTEQLAKTGAASPDELDRASRQAEADDRTAKAAFARRQAAERGGRSDDVEVSRARLVAATARREQAKAVLERLIIRAPSAGHVLAIKYRVGEYVTPGAGDPLMIVGDTTKLRVRMDVDERDVAKVKLGASAFSVLSAYPNEKFPGKVIEIGRRMGRKNVRTDDPTERIDTKILEVVLELDEKSGLVPGLRVTSYVSVD